MRIVDKAFISLGAALSTIGGGGFWLASLSARVEANQKSIGEYQLLNRDTVEILRNIDQRLSRIEGQLTTSLGGKK